LNQDIRESGIIKYQLDIDKFTSHYKTLMKGNELWGHKTGNVIERANKKIVQ